MGRGGEECGVRARGWTGGVSVMGLSQTRDAQAACPLWTGVRRACQPLRLQEAAQMGQQGFRLGTAVLELVISGDTG